MQIELKNIYKMPKERDSDIHRRCLSTRLPVDTSAHFYEHILSFPIGVVTKRNSFNGSH